MADVGVVYTLACIGPTITFNTGIEPFDGTDKYYITEIRGLESPDLRTPFDPVPLGDGALIHDFWYGARHILIEGVILVNSTSIENDIVVVRNDMTFDLMTGLNTIKTNSGSLSFTPQGGSLTSYSVNYEVGLQATHTDNYHTLQFSFGLISAS